MKPTRQRLLIVTRHTPLPWDDGAGAYLHDLAAHLGARHFEVHVLWLEPHEPIRWAKCWTLPAAFSANIRLHVAGATRFGRRYLFPAVVWQPFKARLLHRLGTLPGLRWWRNRRRAAAVPMTNNIPPAAPRDWMSPPTVAEETIVATAVDRLRPDIVMVSYAWLCPLFDLPALRRVRRACLTHDIASQRAALAVGAGPRLRRSALTRETESVWLQRADTLVAISDADARELQTLAPGARVTVAPKAFHVPAPVSDENPPRLLFVGSANDFNAEGLTWFLGEVWPRLRAQAPTLALDVCGNVGSAVTVRPAGVTFHGRVGELAPFYRDAIVVVPLLRATGMNIKLAEAAAYGRPVVATSATLGGAPFLAGAVQTADSAADFTTAILSLLAEPAARRQAGERARAAAQRHLGPAACYAALVTALKPDSR